jgi:ribosomal protein S18 acetylase RimI-like enzyme
MQTSEIDPCLDRVQRILAVDVSYTISRMKILERLPGNPIGIAFRWGGRDNCGVERLPSFARVVGPRAGQESEIQPLVSWYRDRSIKPTFEMVRGQYDAKLGRELARLGFFQCGFHVSLIGEPAGLAGSEDQVPIEQVTDTSSMEGYLEAYVGGWGIAEKDHTQFKANVRPWLSQPGWSLYLGRANGRPVAAATLYVDDGIGYLADATTHPSFRRRGFHSALLRRRIRNAAASGADIVFSGATPFSTSHRNMERAGMRVHFIRSLWTPF